MAVKIRLARRGRKRKPYYHIVVADARSPRDGKFIEAIGSYNPMTSPATIELDQDKALEWMNKGAQPTETARAILRFKGVLYKKHLMRGVAKGAFNEDKANEMWQAWIEAKDTKIAERRVQTELDKKARWVAISGKPGAAPEAVSADDGAAEAFTGNVPSVDIPEAPVETPAAEAVEEAPAVVEEVKEEVKEVVEEAPAVVKEVKEVAKEVVEEAAPVVEEVKEEVKEVVEEAAPVEEVKEEVTAAVEEKVEEAKAEPAEEKKAKGE